MRTWYAVPPQAVMCHRPLPWRAEHGAQRLPWEPRKSSPGQEGADWESEGHSHLITTVLAVHAVGVVFLLGGSPRITDQGTQSPVFITDSPLRL